MLMLSAAAMIAATAPFPIIHYVRSNRDGSQPEHVVHYRPDRTGIAVYKWVSKCTTAAFVTAVMTDDLRSGREFIAGKVARDGSQARFGTLRFDPSAASLVADVNPPGGPRIQDAHRLRRAPYLLYDFDLADLNSFLQEHRPTTDFEFALPVIWPSDGTIFRDLGMLRARHAGRERHLDRDTNRFELTIDGPAPSTGTLWVEAHQGFIVEAELGLPNHMEYRDFRLRIERIAAGGRANWDALTKSQYAGCPAPSQQR